MEVPPTSKYAYSQFLIYYFAYTYVFLTSCIYVHIVTKFNGKYVMYRVTFCIQLLVALFNYPVNTTDHLF